jgi:hypothetical protein
VGKDENTSRAMSRPRLMMMMPASITIRKQGKQDHKKSGIEVWHKIIMNALNMNSNLQSQQSRRRAQSQKLASQDQKSEDTSASDSMLMQRKANNNTHLSMRVDKKRPIDIKNHMDKTRKSEGVRAPSSVEDDDEEAPEIITAPHPNDVLCGRGGSINAHTGNVVFRRWIQERRESYNLADTKSAKTRITSDIFRRVKSLKPSGRFLHKIDALEVSGGIHDDEDYWSEVDDTKALAKISQALREGAPAFRAAHGKTPKSQRPSRRRNSAPGSKKNDADYIYYTRRSKRRKTESPPNDAAYQRSTMREDVDISPPYYNDDTGAAAAAGDINLDIGNYDSLFNHNHMQSYKNSLCSNAGHQAFTGMTSNDNRFDVPKPLNSHPLVNMFDYHASMSDVASAIPPTPPIFKPRMTSFTGTDSLPSLYAQAPASPYAMQYEQFDPYSFLSVPNNNRAEVPKQGKLKREHSLSFSEGELDIEDFTNPFDRDEEQAKGAAVSNKHTTQWVELPYTSPSDPFPSPHVTPPNRGLSFDNIGRIPSGHFLGSRKSSVTSFPSGHFLGSRKSSVTSSGDRVGSQTNNIFTNSYSDTKREADRGGTKTDT